MHDPTAPHQQTAQFSSDHALRDYTSNVLACKNDERFVRIVPLAVVPLDTHAGDDLQSRHAVSGVLVSEDTMPTTWFVHTAGAELVVAKNLGLKWYERRPHGRWPRKGEWLARWTPSLDVPVAILPEDVAQMVAGVPFALVTGTLPVFALHGRLLPRVTLPDGPAPGDLEATASPRSDVAIAFTDDEIAQIRTASELASSLDEVGRAAAYNKRMGNPLLEPLPPSVHLRDAAGGPAGPLPMYSSDDPEHVFVLVSGTFPNYVVRGWISGHEARRLDCQVDTSN